MNASLSLLIHIYFFKHTVPEFDLVLASVIPYLGHLRLRTGTSVGIN